MRPIARSASCSPRSPLATPDLELCQPALQPEHLHKRQYPLSGYGRPQAHCADARRADGRRSRRPCRRGSDYPERYKTTKTAIVFILRPLAAASQAAEPPSPIPAAELYIRTLVNHDDQAIVQLNEYLRPDRVRSGRSADYANAADLKAADKDFAREVAGMALPLFPEAQRQALREPVESLMSQVQKTRQQTQC